MLKLSDNLKQITYNNDLPNE